MSDTVDRREFLSCLGVTVGALSLALPAETLLG